MENSAVEVDDAVATIIANVNFGEFAPEVADGSYVVAHIQEATTTPGDIQDGTGAFQQFKQESDGVEEKAAKKERKPRKRRTEEDGEYPNIKEWKPYINSLIDKGINGLYKKPVPTYQSGSGPPKVAEYLEPDVIIWDLQKEFPEIANGSCPEVNCAEPLSLYPIAYTYMMRILYDFDKPILLVTSMLRCKNGREHRFLGYDPRILKQMTDPEKVPFVLFHKVGLTRELFNSIMNQVSNGVKFGQIQDILRKSYLKSHLERKEAYDTAVEQYSNGNPKPAEVPKSFPAIKVKGPRNTFIGQCFLLGFKDKEYFYKLSMSQILADDWIKLDANFKLPTNVGTNANGVWKKEVDNLFYCLNEVGQVLTWQLTGKGKFEEVRSTLVSTKERHDQVGKQLKGCCTELCCDWRDSLKSIFGADFEVKNDVDVALCKLSEKLQEDGQLFAACMDDFRLVFQDPVDCNKVRILHTPPPNVIAGSLESFLEKWRKIKDESGKNVLTCAALKAITEMEHHILNGCFSDIPPFANGIERKEFQTILRKKLNNCRLGIPVMVAIATIALHEHNTTRQGELGRDTAPVLLVVPDEDKAASEANSSLSLGSTNLQCLTVEVNMNKALESIASSQAKAVKYAEKIDSKSLMQAVDDYILTMKKDSKDHDYETKDQSGEEVIIKRALMFLRYHESLLQFVPSMFINEKLIPFLTCAFPLLMQEGAVDDKELDQNTIDEMLVNFQDLKAVKPIHVKSTTSQQASQEHNFFQALAVVLESFLKSPADTEKGETEISAFQELLKEQRFEFGMSLADIFSNLIEKSKRRQEGENMSDAKNNSSDTASESKGNKETEESAEGEFEILVREMGTLLSSQISLISDLAYFPVIPIFPQQMFSWSPNLFLLCKGGRFIPVVSANATGTPQQNAAANGSKAVEGKVQGTVKCRCGRGHYSKEGKCYTHANSRYISRCACFRLQQACTNKCDCRNCMNPFGDRPVIKKGKPAVSVIGPPFKRRRHTHHHAGLSKDLVAENFQPGAGLEMSLAKWSLAEKFLFEALISELKTEEETLTTELVAQKFNNVVQVALNITGLQELVGFKTPTQVNERLKEREKDVETYLQMYQKQLDLLIKKDGEETIEGQEENSAGMQTETS